MFLYNQWYIAAFRRDVSEKPRRQIIAGLPLVLYRLPNGSAVALEDRCPHRDVPLSMGSLQADGTLQCLYHGIRFDRDGSCTFIPEQTVVPAGCRVKSYPLRECGEWAWVFMGDPALADGTEIPAYPWFSRPGWQARTAHLHVKCNYKQLVDNLLNMAHLPYVHPRTIGSEGVVANAQMDVARRGAGVRLSRRMYNIEAPPTYKRAGGFEGNVNRWQTIDFMPPGFFEFDTGVIDAAHDIPDTTRPLDLPSNARVLSRHTMHGVVPETAQTSNYYVGFAYDPAGMAEETVDFIFDSVLNTFREDVEILEAQQANMELLPGAQRIHIKSDSAGIMALRVIEELEKQEASGAA
jgi:phenylpropionate dioxygenase-like ring-hydroxylating dioxygenase large terminal subunit